MAIGEILGKLTGHWQCIRPFARASLPPVVIIIFWMLFVYVTDFYAKFHFYHWITLALMLFMTFRYASVLSSYLISGNMAANKTNKDAIGSILNYSLLSGMAFGNLISISFPYIKQMFYKFG